jgi:hypothetical protein
MAAIPLALSLLSSEFIPRIFAAEDKTSLLVMGIGAGLVGCFLWGAWHILMNAWTSGESSGALEPALFPHSFVFPVGIPPDFRVLMVQDYDRTGNLMPAALARLSLIIANVLFVPVEVAWVPGVMWSLVIDALLWIEVAAANGGNIEMGIVVRTR